MQQPPGPKGNPIYGNLEAFEDDRLGFLQECAKEYGDIVRFSDRVYIINHPEHVRDILARTGKDFVIASDLFARRVAEADTSAWMQHRHLITTHTKRSHLADFAPSIANLTKRTLDEIGDGISFDVLATMEQITSGAITEYVFGNEGISIPESAARLLDALLVMIGNPFVVPPWVPTPTNLRIRRRKQDMEKVLLDIIESRKAKPEQDLLSILVTADWPFGRPSNEQLAGVLIGMLLAGHRVPAAALTWIWFLLDGHGDYESRLHNEVDGIFAEPSPQSDLLQKLTYTQALVKEALRLYPPTWLMESEVLNPVELGGYHLPKGLKLLFSPFIIHRDPRFYPEAETFKPERWLNPVADEPNPNHAYFPFGGGPRLCLGTNFAIVELMVVTATIARKYMIRVKNPQVELDCRATLLPKHLKAQLKPRFASLSADYI